MQPRKFRFEGAKFEKNNLLCTINQNVMAKEQFSKRIDGATPNGGQYSILYFRDKDGRPCVEKKAATVEAVEYTSDGDELFRTHAVVNSDEVTPE